MLKADKATALPRRPTLCAILLPLCSQSRGAQMLRHDPHSCDGSFMPQHCNGVMQRARLLPECSQPCEAHVLNAIPYACHGSRGHSTATSAYAVPDCCLCAAQSREAQMLHDDP